MNPNVFREYDIRGLSDSDLTDDFVLDLGRASARTSRAAGSGAWCWVATAACRRRASATASPRGSSRPAPRSST